MTTPPNPHPEQVEAIGNAILVADTTNPVWRGLLLDAVLASLAKRPADDGEKLSAKEQVARWHQEYLADPAWHWGDRIAWQSVFFIARKLDEVATLPPQPEGEKRP